MSDEAPKLRITLLRNENCRPVPIGGAWGGAVAGVEVLAAFYQDYPSHASVVIRDQIARKETAETDSEFMEMNREVYMIAIMRPDVAMAIGNLLINSAKTILAPEQDEKENSQKG